MASGRVGDAVVGVLGAASVRTVFGIPGIHTLGLYDALAGTPSIRHILTRHEQGAAFAADGYARVLGVPGRVLDDDRARHVQPPWRRSPRRGRTRRRSSSWRARSTPPSMGSVMGVLHETPDQGRSFEALTAFTGRPRTTADIPAAVAEALRCSMTGRRRPAYVELPTDLLLQPYEGDVPGVDFPGPVVPDPASVVDAARVLSGASRVVIMPGAGVHRRAGLGRAAPARGPPRCPGHHADHGRGCHPGRRPVDGPVSSTRA
jgi:acetolactate synthase-1/2/3 large subunit